MTTGSHPFRNGLINQAGKKRRTSDDLPPFIGNYVPVLQERSGQRFAPSSTIQGPSYWEQLGRQLWWLCRQLLNTLMSWRPRDLLFTPLVLIIVWVVVLWWGEEAVFTRKVQDCSWDRWETWVRRHGMNDYDLR